jgi:hypothetical protein
MIKNIGCYTAYFAMLAFLPALPAAPVNRAALQRQDMTLLQRLEDNARDVEDTAERLDSYNRVPDEYSRQCHLSQLEALKAEINVMAPVIEHLAATRDGLDDADRKAVSRVIIAAVELAQGANAVIVTANATADTPGLSSDYRKLMNECYRDSGALVKMLEAAEVELK